MAKKKQRKPKKWVQTVVALAETLELNRVTVHKWMRVDGFPEKTNRGYNVIKCHEFILEQKQGNLRATQGPDAEVRSRKLDLECGILQARLDVLRGDAVPIADHNRELAWLAQVFVGAMDQFIDQVESTTRDSKLAKGAKRLCDRARTTIMEKVNARK